MKKDKLFFFTSYQETWQKNGVAAAGLLCPYFAPIPTGDRSNTAAFQAALGAVFCPTGTAGGIDFEWRGAGRLQRIEHQSGGHQSSRNSRIPMARYYIPSSSNGEIPRHHLQYSRPVSRSIRLLATWIM